MSSETPKPADEGLAGELSGMIERTESGKPDTAENRRFLGDCREN